MNGESHRLTTEKAFSLLRDMEGDLSFLSDEVKDKVASAVVETDNLEDLEFFVDIAGSVVGVMNEYYYESWGQKNTAFNHFIDIKKGLGLFDDYDGYSYERGSAHQDQFMLASEDASGILEHIGGFFTDLGDVKLDQATSWYLGEFRGMQVHAPGQPGYPLHAPGRPGYPYLPGKGSPSIEHYSFPQDKGIYSSVETESAARFAGTIPSCVFLPVDNLARYWYGQFLDTKDPTALGHVMHAIDDASIPHHAAGYMGNWHQRYEADVEKNLESWLEAPDFAPGVRALVEQWSRIDSSPPVFLSYPEDVEKVPAQNWRIDQLVTWLALHAYQAYDQIYQQYRNGPLKLNIQPTGHHHPVVGTTPLDGDSARNLTQLATAMSVLVLRKALSLPPRSVRRSVPSWLSILLQDGPVGP